MSKPCHVGFAAQQIKMMYSLQVTLVSSLTCNFLSITAATLHTVAKLCTCCCTFENLVILMALQPGQLYAAVSLSKFSLKKLTAAFSCSGWEAFQDSLSPKQGL